MYSVRYLHGWIQVANAADVGDDAIAVKAAAAAVEIAATDATDADAHRLVARWNHKRRRGDR